MTNDADAQSLSQSPTWTGSDCNYRCHPADCDSTRTSYYTAVMTSPDSIPLPVIHEGSPPPPRLSPTTTHAHRSPDHQQTCAIVCLENHSQLSEFSAPAGGLVWALPGNVLPMMPALVPAGRQHGSPPSFVNIFPGPTAFGWPTTVIHGHPVSYPDSPVTTPPTFATATHSRSSFSNGPHFCQAPRLCSVSPVPCTPTSADSARHNLFEAKFKVLKNTSQPEEEEEEENGDIEVDDCSSVRSDTDSANYTSVEGANSEGKQNNPFTSRRTMAYPSHSPTTSMSTSPHGNDLRSHNDSDNDLSSSTCDIPLQEMREFAVHFKERRTKLGYTQADVGLELRGVYGMEFSQATICRFESLSLSYENLCRWKVKLESWLTLAESRGPAWSSSNASLCSVRRSKQRRRTMIGPVEKKALVAFFERKPRPCSEDVADLARKLHLSEKVIKTWLGNYRQKVRRLRAFRQLDCQEQQDTPLSNKDEQEEQ